MVAPCSPPPSSSALDQPAVRGSSVLAVVVDAEHVSGRVTERPRLHVVIHGHGAVDPGPAEGLGLGQRLLYVGNAGVDRGPAGLLAGTEATLDALPGAGLGHAVLRGTTAYRPAEQVRVEPLGPARVGAEHLEPVDRRAGAS